MPRKVKKLTVDNAPVVKKRPRRKRKTKSPATVRWVAFFLFVLVIVAIANYDLFSGGEPTLIRGGVSIGPIDAGGRTMDEAAADLREYLAGYHLTFVTPQGTESIGPFVDTNQDLVEFHVETAIDTAFGVGRHKNSIVALAQRISAGILGTSVPIPYSLHEEPMLQELESRFGSLVNPAEDASLRILVTEDGTYDIEVLPEKDGVNFDTDSLLQDTRNRLRNLSASSVKVEITLDTPDLTTEELSPLVDQAGTILERAPQAVTAEELSWTISRSQLADWIVPLPDEQGHWTIALDHNRMAKHLEAYASSIAIEPMNAVFEMGEDGRVARFEPGINGKKLDVAASTELLEQAFLEASADGETIDLPVTVALPEVTTDSSNEFGIKDLIGLGETSFRGSPPNRRHNIATGANTLNGILVAPGDEFSLMGALGEIDAANGYLQELVIKQNETKPEFGGGLCQIGTTTFRAVLASGLPVTERRNHSYRVSYYERDGDGTYIGPGKDATIYDPWPDFKFKNDTPAHVLIQTAIDGNRLSFYFWGTDDGRLAEEGEVSIWNINDPPPKREIFTTDLAPGEFKCTEHPHPSASTVFTYSVTYPDGELVEEKFYSYYKPWQEVCAVGVTEEELAQKQAEAAAGEVGESGDPPEVPPDGPGMEEAEG